MKILKPGKVEGEIEFWKYTCPKCGCIFVADQNDKDFEYSGHIKCPQEGCDWYVFDVGGEPYEEPTTMQTDRERLAQLVGETPDVKVWPDAQLKISNYLIAHGVTFREG